MATSKLRRKPLTFEGNGSAIQNYFSPKPQDGENWSVFDKDNPKHKLILSLLRQAQWVTTHPRLGEVADLKRFNEWLHNHSPVKCALLKMTPEETEKVIAALSGLVISTSKKR